MSSKTTFTRSVAIDHSRWLPVEATRSTVGVVVTLVVSILLNNPGAGALASIGALYTGMAASTGVYHARVRAMAASGLMIGLGTALGALVGLNELASWLSVFTVAFCTALYAASSRAAGTIGAQTTAILCVVIGLRLSPSGAAVDGLIVFSGSATQLFLLTVVWPMKEGIPERNAVSEAFEALARFVLDIPSHRGTESPQIPPSVQIQDARDLLSEAERLHWNVEHDQLFETLRRAEAIRAALVGFAQVDRQFSKLDRASQVRADRILRTIARSLRRIGEHAQRGLLCSEAVSLKVPVLPADSDAAVAYKDWLQMLIKLVRDCGRQVPIRPRRTGHSKLRSLFSTLTQLPDIEAVRSVAIQHAFRYAFTVEAAFAISQHWTRSHSYWLPVTVALVLRQDYGSTFQRGIGRLAGTVAGLAIADIVMQVFHPGVIPLQILTLVATWFAFASVLASYTVASAAVTGFVVFSIASAGVAMGDLSYMRLVASVFGIFLAVLSYILWPAWHWSQVWATLRSTAQAQSDYSELVLDAHAARLSGGVKNRATDLEIDDARSDARALRIQSENLLESIKVHPKGLDKRLLKIAEDASQTLEENAATILVAQAAWDTSHPETDDQLRSALTASRQLVTQLNEVIR